MAQGSLGAVVDGDEEELMPKGKGKGRVLVVDSDEEDFFE
jgi:hypothetical protein